MRPLVGFQSLLRVLHKFLDVLTMLLDVVMTSHDRRGVSLLEVLRAHCLQLTLEEGFLPFIHHSVHFLNIVFHFPDEVINVDND